MGNYQNIENIKTEMGNYQNIKNIKTQMGELLEY